VRYASAGETGYRTARDTEETLHSGGAQSDHSELTPERGSAAGVQRMCLTETGLFLRVRYASAGETVGVPYRTAGEIEKTLHSGGAQSDHSELTPGARKRCVEFSVGA
jgi:hypothetical protein